MYDIGQPVVPNKIYETKLNNIRASIKPETNTPCRPRRCWDLHQHTFSGELAYTVPIDEQPSNDAVIQVKTYYASLD